MGRYRLYVHRLPTGNWRCSTYSIPVTSGEWSSDRNISTGSCAYDRRESLQDGKTDEYSSEYQIGDIFEVEGTWYGGVHITGKTGIPVSLDREEYEEITDMTPEEYQVAAVYWVEKDKESKHMELEQLKQEADAFKWKGHSIRRQRR